MKARNVLVCLLLAMFALAAATVITTDNTQGHGRAANSHNRAYFSFAVTKVSHNDHVVVNGAFSLIQPGATATDSISVYLNPVQGMVVAQNVATFGGDGVLRVQHGHDLHYYHGRVYVVATSNRHPGEAGSPDTLNVHFVPTNTGDPTFVFEGPVTDGDIAVTTMLSY